MAASRLQQPEHRSEEERSLRQDIDEMFSNLGHLADIGSLQVPHVHLDSLKNHGIFPSLDHISLKAPPPRANTASWSGTATLSNPLPHLTTTTTT